MARTGWYRDHPRSCTCYWCNEGRKQGGRRRRFRLPFRREDRERRSTPLPDWMLEGLHRPTEEDAGIATEAHRPRQAAAGTRGGFGRTVMWGVIVAAIAAAVWVVFEALN